MYKNALEEFERQFNAVDFNFYDVDWWPLIRIQVLYLLNLQASVIGDYDLADNHGAVLKLNDRPGLKERVINALTVPQRGPKNKQVAVFTSSSHNIVRDGLLENRLYRTTYRSFQ